MQAKTRRSNSALVWLSAASLVLVCACNRDRVTGPTVPVPSDFTLAVGEHVTLVPEGVEVGFRQVAGDSRCPANVQCIWVGSAGVHLWLKPANRDSVFADIQIEGNGSGSVDALGYRITAVRLEPYPQTTGPIPESAYRVALHVDKRGS